MIGSPRASHRFSGSPEVQRAGLNGNAQVVGQRWPLRPPLRTFWAGTVIVLALEMAGAPLAHYTLYVGPPFRWSEPRLTGLRLRTSAQPMRLRPLALPTPPRGTSELTSWCMPLKPETKPPLDTPEKCAAAPPRCVFLATEKFCQTWGDLFQPGDLVEIVHSKVVVSDKPSVVHWDWGIRKVSGVPSCRA
jgi:hypothetical protein